MPNSLSCNQSIRSHNLDLIILTYASPHYIIPGMVKKLAFLLVALSFLSFPGVAKAETTTVICPQPYGGGVVCGVHTTVDAGIADSLPMIGFGLLGASSVFAYISKKLNKSQ